MGRFAFTGAGLMSLAFTMGATTHATAQNLEPLEIIKPPPSPVPPNKFKGSPIKPVEIINPPSLPVPVIRTDRLPIPSELINFSRLYCAIWTGPEELSKDGSRRLLEYKAQLPTINFTNRVFWIGELKGDLVGPENEVQIARYGEVEVDTACSDPSEPIPDFYPLLNTSTKNLYVISDDEVRGFACEFDGIFPVDIRLRVPILLYEDLVNDLPSAPPGTGRICVELTFIGPAATE